MTEGLTRPDTRTGDLLDALRAASPDESRRQLPEVVASYVRELILSGGIKRGEFLRLEPIAEALGVSNTPVREGLLSLGSEGLVSLVPRRGFVAQSFTRQDVEDIFWVQAMVGSELAARAAANVSVQDLDLLHETHERHLQAVRNADTASIAKFSYEFHTLISFAASAGRLSRLLDSTARLLPSHFHAAAEARVQSAEHAHTALLESLKNQSPRAARAQMRDHILAVGESLIGDLASRGIWGDAVKAAS
jgi:DNA-binding GntR family transcriptional regulator